MLALLPLPGCFAALGAAALASSAASGFLLFKGVQLSTGGSVEVGFEKASPNGETSRRLRAARTLAVWPSDTSAALIANELESYSGLEIATPRSVSEAAEELDLDADLALLTANERQDVLRAVAEKLGVDAVLVTDLSQSADTRLNMWSFDQSEASRAFSIDFYVFRPEATRWSVQGELKLKGANQPNSSEVMNAFSSTVAEKVAVTLGLVRTAAATIGSTARYD